MARLPRMIPAEVIPLQEHRARRDPPPDLVPPPTRLLHPRPPWVRPTKLEEKLLGRYCGTCPGGYADFVVDVAMPSGMSPFLEPRLCCLRPFLDIRDLAAWPYGTIMRVTLCEQCRDNGQWVSWSNWSLPPAWKEIVGFMRRPVHGRRLDPVRIRGFYIRGRGLSAHTLEDHDVLCREHDRSVVTIPDRDGIHLWMWGVEPKPPPPPPKPAPGSLRLVGR